MFKGKIWIWVGVLAGCFIITFFVNNIPKWVYKEEIDVSFDISKDNTVSNIIANSEIGKTRIKLGNSTSDVIFTDKEIEYDETKYEKKDSFLYSPMIGMINEKVLSYSDGFISASTTERSAKQLNLKTVLIGVENGSTWKDLGVSTKVIKGEIILTIPDDGAAYYDDVVELFYLTLNDGKTPTDEEREALKPRVENILSKCDKVSSILDAVNSEFKKSSTDGKFFISPEFIYSRLGSAKDYSHYSSSFIPVYFLNTVVLKTDAYFAKTSEGLTTKSQMLYDTLIGRKGWSFFTYTGWRVEGMTLDNNLGLYLLSLS